MSCSKLAEKPLHQCDLQPNGSSPNEKSIGCSLFILEYFHTIVHQLTALPRWVHPSLQVFVQMSSVTLVRAGRFGNPLGYQQFV